MLQSTHEQYFDELDRDSLGVFSDTLNPRYIGCYTSQIRIKQLHTKLESELFTTEKMAAHSTASKLMKYPSSNISKAAKDLLFIQFHDILPGTAIQPVEEYSINLAGHGLEELRDAKTHAFISLCSGQKAADDGQIPLLVYNPHPYEVPYIVECEFQLPDQNKNREIFANPVVYQNGKKIPCQVEKESSNFNVDWRKRSVFRAMLKPGQINRFDAVIEMIDKKPEPNVRQNKDSFIFKTKELTVHISKSKGTMDKYMVNGVDYLSGNGFLPVVIKDDENSWAHKERHFRNTEGFFKLMDKQEAAVFSGILADEHPESVRAIEDGPVRTIIEAVMKYEHSTLAIRYHLPKKGTQVKVTVTVYWNEKMKMLKLSLPTTIENGRYVGQQAYGSEKLKTDGEEMVSHRWNVLYNNEKALSVINNGTYGSDVLDSEMRLSLLRSPGYAAGKSDFSVRNPHIMPQDRFSHYIDQGERSFEFYLDASAPDERLAFVERESDVCNEKPMALSFFPTGEGKRVRAFAKLSDDVVTMPVFKRSENQKGYVVRLFNPTAQNRSTTLELPVFRVKESFDLKPYEVRSFMFDTKAKTMTEINFVEQAK